MAMNKTAMANYIINRMLALVNPTPVTALKEFGDSISDYIKNNAEFTFSWAAQLPYYPYTVDPTTTTTGKFSTLNIVFTQSRATTVIAARNHIRNEIIAGMTAAFYNITASGFSTTPASMSSSATLQALVIEYYATTQLEAMEKLSNLIITWVKALAPTAPCAGSHGSYVGTGMVTAII